MPARSEASTERKRVVSGSPARRRERGLRIDTGLVRVPASEARTSRHARQRDSTRPGRHAARAVV
ncbi:MAG: hypothetical protein ACLPQS_03575, partial [Acidimicrobiales bacterium]